jgi:hypothetical protein
MQWLQRLLPKLLVLGAIGVTAVALLSDHKNDYGSVTLPGGGVVDLPEGTLNVFVDEDPAPGAVDDDAHDLSAALNAEAVPVAGGEPVVMEPAADSGNVGELASRSEAIGSRGTVATMDVPAAGSYRITGSMADDSSVELGFGLSSWRAVAHDWMLIAGLLVAAFLISLIRVPKRSRREEVELAAPPRPVTPYRG